MTPQARLAIEIMSECGMTPREIAADRGWLTRIAMQDVLHALNAKTRIRVEKRSHFVKAFGETRSLAEWGKISGVSPQLIGYRLRQQMEPEKAITQRPRA